jgi:putative transposase
MLAEGVSCGLHRIERLMRLQALKARPRRARPHLRGACSEPQMDRRLHLCLDGRRLTLCGSQCSRSGNAWDNARWSFFSSLKTERTARKIYRTRQDAKPEVFDYIKRFYNAKHRHSKIGYMSPVEFGQQAGLGLSGCQPNRVQAIMTITK